MSQILLEAKPGLEWLQKVPPGIVWYESTFTFSPVPHWTEEPDLQAIQQTIQALRPSSTVQVNCCYFQPPVHLFIAQNDEEKLEAVDRHYDFIKVYDVKIDDDVFVVRVTLPLDPYYKTVSEVSTMNWISCTTNIPVPQVITYQSSQKNPIGFEWILTTKMPGRSLKDMWHSLPFSAKVNLTEEVAACLSCLFRKRFQGIGSLHKTASGLSEATWPAEFPTNSEKECLPIGSSDLGRIVSMPFIWGSHMFHDVQRGPFTSSRDWMTARLSLIEKDCHSKLANLSSEDEDDDIEDYTITALKFVGQLKALLPSFFPQEEKPEPSALAHEYLDSNKILVHDNGELAAILDWGCVSAYPLWKVCDYPKFLDGQPIRIKPDIEARYYRNENGEVDDGYWSDLLDYETTLLRDVFINKMKTLEPEWVEIFNKSQRQRDFELAVTECNDWLAKRNIRGWLNQITTGVENPRSLSDTWYDYWE